MCDAPGILTSRISAFLFDSSTFQTFNSFCYFLICAVPPNLIQRGLQVFPAVLSYRPSEAGRRKAGAANSVYIIARASGADCAQRPALFLGTADKEVFCMKDYSIMDDANAIASARRLTARDVLDMVRFAAGMICVPALMLVLSQPVNLI